MICPRCKKNKASVHVTEIEQFVQQGNPDNQVNEHHVCEVCAQQMNLPHIGVPVPKTPNIWKLLQLPSGGISKAVGSSPVCKHCGMTLDELRRRGRVGCARDYEVFVDYLGELLERMHGASEHVGRLPGIAEGELERIQRVTDLKGELELAVREEDYERAAGLRDEIKNLETQASAGS